MSLCERCGRAPRFSKRRYRCAICKRLVCERCCEAMDRTQGQRSAWCSKRDDVGNPLPDDCREPQALPSLT